MCCSMCTFVPSGGIMNPFFLRGQLNVHTWHHSKFTDNTKKNKQKWYYLQSKNFSGTNGTIRNLKTFKIISNEMPILLLILCWSYFSCLWMYSEKFFNISFHEQMYFQIFEAKGDTCWFFWEITTYEQYKFR